MSVAAGTGGLAPTGGKETALDSVSVELLVWAVSAPDLEAAVAAIKWERTAAAATVVGNLMTDYTALVGFSKAQSLERLVDLRNNGVARGSSGNETAYAAGFEPMRDARTAVRSACIVRADGPGMTFAEPPPPAATGDLVSVADAASALGVEPAQLTAHLPSVIAAAVAAGSVGARLMEGYTSALCLTPSWAALRLRSLQLAGAVVDAAGAFSVREREYAALFEPLRAFRAALAASVTARIDRRQRSTHHDSISLTSSSASAAVTTYGIDVGGTSLTVTPSTPLLAVMQVVAARTRVPVDKQVLSHKERALLKSDISRTLADLHTGHGSRLDLLEHRPTTHLLVFVVVPTGRRIAVELALDATAADVQQFICRRHSVPLRRQKLYHNSTLLVPTAKLRDQGVEDMDTLDLEISHTTSDGMQVFAKTVSGKTITLHVQPLDTVECLMFLIECRDGFPALDQRLIFAGRQLELGRTLSAYSVPKEATFHVVGRLR